MSDKFPKERGPSVSVNPELSDCFSLEFSILFTLKPKKWRVRVDFPGPGAYKSRNISGQEPEPPSSLVLQHDFSCLSIMLVSCICTWLRSQWHLSAQLIAGSLVLRQSWHPEVCYEYLSYGSLVSKEISPKLCYQWLRWVWSPGRRMGLCLPWPATKQQLKGEGTEPPTTTCRHCLRAIP